MATAQAVTKKSSATSVFICPKCKNSLAQDTEALHCIKCCKSYPIVDGIYCFLTEDYDGIFFQQLWKTDERSSAATIENAKPSIIDFKETVMGNFRFSGRILEVGGGLCWASRLIKQSNPDCQVFSSDLTLQALRKAAALSKNGVSSDYLLASRVEKLPFPDNFFDYIYGSAFLIYTQLPAAFVELRRVLKVGGYYIGIRECASSHLFSPFYSLLYARKADAYAGVSKLYSYKEWLKALKNAGFTHYQVNSCRTIETKASESATWYKIAAKIPDILLQNLLFTEIHLIMKK